MKNILHSLSAVLGGGEKISSPKQQFVTVGGQVFAVAHSQQEMSRLMRMPNQNVEGYVFKHRV